MAASSWDLVAPLFKLSVVSRAYTLKKYLCALPGGGQGLVFGHTQGQSAAIGRNIVDHPVNPGFAGGSGLSTIRAMDCVPAGMVSHESTGEWSSPSQVCSTGRLLPSLKASEDIEICFIVVSSIISLKYHQWSSLSSILCQVPYLPDRSRKVY